MDINVDKLNEITQKKYKELEITVKSLLKQYEENDKEIPKNKSEVIYKSIGFVIKSLRDPITKTLIEPIAQSQKINVSFAIGLTKEELESCPLLSHAYAAVDTRTMKVKSQYVIKEDKMNEKKEYVDLFRSDEDFVDMKNCDYNSDLLVRDKKLYSPKHKAAGIKIQIICNYYGLITHLSLPHQASSNDLSVYQINSNKDGYENKEMIFISNDNGLNWNLENN